MNDLPELVLIVAVFQLVVDVFKVGNVQLAFALNVEQGEVGSSSLFREGATLNRKQKYNSGGEFLKESFEVEGVASSLIMDLMEKSEDELVFGIETKSGSGEEDIPDISSPLARVSIEGENCVDLSNVVSSKDGVFGSNVLGKDCLQILFLKFSFWHDIS